jgi:hypothetical protein
MLGRRFGGWIRYGNRYKSVAFRLLNSYLSTKEKKLSDNLFSAVNRVFISNPSGSGNPPQIFDIML